MKRKLYAISQTELRAAPAASGINSEAAISREMVFYAGTPVYRFDMWSGQEYMLRFDMSEKAVDLSRMSNAPLLTDHVRSIDTTVGVVEKAWLSGGKGYASFRLADTPDAAIIRQKVEDGIIRQVSMEATVETLQEVTPRGARMKEFLATRWTPAAVSLVAVGADPGAQLLADEQAEDLWLSEGIYVPRAVALEQPSQILGQKPALDHVAEAGAASQQHNLLARLLLMQRGQWAR